MMRTMAERLQLAVDASLAVAALLYSEDEPYKEIANQVFTDFHEGRIHLIAPEHIRVEVGHALLRAVRRQRISLQEGADRLDLFYSWQLETVRHTGLLLGGWRLAQRYGCSFYDAGYLALAVMADCRFIHADGKLRNNLGVNFTTSYGLNHILGDAPRSQLF